MYRNLSEFIARLEREGELQRVSVPVDPVYEIAEITDRMSKQPDGGKALLFEQTGTPFPVLTNMMGSDRRMAMALGVESLDELTRRLDDLLQQAVTPKIRSWINCGCCLCWPRCRAGCRVPRRRGANVSRSCCRGRRRRSMRCRCSSAGRATADAS